MSVFQRLFGYSKENDPAQITPEKAIENLQSVEELLNKKQGHLESQIEEQKHKALLFSKQGNKRAAIGALKQKKRYEKILSQLDGTLTTLEIQRESLQNVSTNMEVLSVMRVAAGAMKKAHQNLDIDDVEELNEEIAEQNRIAEELANLISSPGLSSTDYDNDELDRELAALVLDGDNQLNEKIDALPSVPISTAPKTKVTSSQELAEF